MRTTAQRSPHSLRLHSPPLPVSRLCLSHCFLSIAHFSHLWWPFAHWRTRTYAHTHIHLKLIFYMSPFWGFFFPFLLRQPSVRPSSDSPLCAGAPLVQSASVRAGKTMLPSRLQQYVSTFRKIIRSVRRFHKTCHLIMHM